jgi:hypothetical protein
MGLLDDVGPRSGGSPCRHRRHAGDERLGAQRGVLSRFLPDAGRSGFHGGCHGFAGQISAALWFLAATPVYLAFGLFVTTAVNVPMNEALAKTLVPADIDEAQKICEGYSERWQFWNQVRAIASGIALIFAAVGLTRLRPAVAETV